VLKQKGGTAWVDGENLLGAVVGNFCTDLAIKLAKEFGVAWVVTKNSNHYGACQHYTKKIANAGMVVSSVKFLKDYFIKYSGNVIYKYFTSHVPLPFF